MGAAILSENAPVKITKLTARLPWAHPVGAQAAQSKSSAPKDNEKHRESRRLRERLPTTVG